MQYLKPWALPLGVLAAMSLLTTTTHAQTVTATFSNVNPGEVVGITVNGQTEYGWAGVYNFTGASGYINGNYSGFCIEVSQDIYQNQMATWNVASLASAPVPGPGMGSLRAALIGELWYNDYALIGTSNSNAAAFQIAIWEIENGTLSNLNVQTGSFVVQDSDTATLCTANQWLAALDLSGNSPQAPNLFALTNPDYQDYVVQAAPAPSGLVLGLIGAGSLILPAAFNYRKRLSLASALSAQ